jgi:glycosyltransferase involved in cell wall biosynthesis
VILHLDDALYLEYPYRYRIRARLAHRVLTGNREIAAWAEAVGAKVSVFDGPLQVESYVQVKHAERDTTTIGWLGKLPQHDLPPILPALVSVSQERRIRVKVVSENPYYYSSGINGNWVWEPWSLAHEYDCLADVDIGIAPLPDTPYNRAREAFKVKEFMAAGIPVVSAPVGQNKLAVEDGRSGMFATTTIQWRDALIALIDDPSLRGRMGDHARRSAAERYGLASQTAKLARIVREIATDCVSGSR